MDLASYRKELGLSQDELAPVLGLKSKGSLSAIETGAEKAGLELALRIQAWSAGRVRAAELRPDLADLIAEAARPPAPAEGVAA